MQVMVGARLLDVEEKFNWQTSGNIATIPLPGRQGSVSDKASNWDAIVGVKGRFAFGERGEWFIPYYADVGTGDSHLTWQAIAGIGPRSHGATSSPRGGTSITTSSRAARSTT